MNHKDVQQIAKDTMNYIRTVIHPGISLSAVRKMCEGKMFSLGADSFWYYDIGAFIFSGNETVLSVSGRDYQTSDRVIQDNDIITIDLSPQNSNTWGDYAGTIIIENGIVVPDIADIKNEEWKKGLLMEEQLHKELKAFAVPFTTFEEIYEHMNRFILEHGYINLDFLGNLGHSIEKDKKDRIYIEKGNSTRLCDVDLFTFEPHIGKCNIPYGYKKENIYRFINQELTAL